MDQSTKTPPTPAGTDSAQPDIERVVANALSDIDALNTIATDAVAASIPAEFDLGDMEKQIQALLSPQEPATEAVAEAAPAASAPTVAPDAPAHDVRTDALEAEPVDPLIREIDAALADDADALLKDANGDVGQALRSVFDERALSGQEEEINRALIEAFGTSRVERPSFAQPAVTNPLPGFDGAARELPPNIPREDRDLDSSQAPQESPEPIAPAGASTMAETTASHAQHEQAAHTAVAHEAAAPTPAPTSAPAPVPTPQPTSRAAGEATGATTIETKPHAARGAGFLPALLALPLRALSAPMRVMPDTARAVLSIAAITLALWTPVAWWLAQRAAQVPAVGPITIKPAVAAAAPAEASKSEPAKSGGSSEHAQPEHGSGGGH